MSSFSLYHFTLFHRRSTSSDSGEEFSKTEFITCFGGEDERNGKRNATANVDEDAEGDNSGIVHGPILPTMEYRRLLYLLSSFSQFIY